MPQSRDKKQSDQGQPMAIFTRFMTLLLEYLPELNTPH